MKQKKIENSFFIIIFSIALLYVVIFSFTLWLIKENYYAYKYSNVYTYYIENSEKTLEDLLNYSYSQGFAITQIDEQGNEVIYQLFFKSKTLQTPLDNVTLNFEESNKSFIVGVGTSTFSLNFNPNIINDITSVLYIFGTFVLVLFLILLYFTYFFVKKIIIKPLLLISDYVENLTKFKKVKYPILKENNEINQILSRIILLDQTVEKEIKNKNEILRAISHEFRTPLAHITTILYLYENKVDEYKDFKYAKEQIVNTIEENKKLVTMTLDSFVGDTNAITEDINITNLIEQQIKTYASENVKKDIQINLEEITINANIISISLIINNLLSNISKYSLNYIKIYTKNGELIFENDYDPKKEIKVNVGSTIIHSLTKSENIKMKQKLDDKVYTTILRFN